MKFLIDAQLPRRLCSWLAAAGHDAVHTLDLPKRNRTTDEEILDLAEQEDRIVVTGNISNTALENLIRTNLTIITDSFKTHRFIEIGHESLMIHE